MVNPNELSRSIASLITPASASASASASVVTEAPPFDAASVSGQIDTLLSFLVRTAGCELDSPTAPHPFGRQIMLNMINNMREQVDRAVRDNDEIMMADIAEVCYRVQQCMALLGFRGHGGDPTNEQPIWRMMYQRMSHQVQLVPVSRQDTRTERQDDSPDDESDESEERDMSVEGMLIDDPTNRH